MTSEAPRTFRTRRPSESAFKQQKLPAWQPILTAGTVLPAFFVIGIAFLPIGIGLLYFSDGVKELQIDYTHCNSTAGGVECSRILQTNPKAACKCEIQFALTEDYPGDVFMYYGLSNFYQNHRRYVKSRDDYQLLGNLASTPSSECYPYQYDDAGKPIAPCGAIANSLFSDSLALKYLDKNVDVPLLRTGIAWPSDKNVKFKNPPGSSLQIAFKDYAKPINWTRNVWELDLENPSNNGFQNEDLIVWMRTAALPTFRKLYRRVDHSKEMFREGLKKGEYLLTIDYNYPVIEFGGTKRMILANTSILGGKNPFLGVSYIVVGSVCLILGVILLFIHVKCSKSTTELINVNPRTPYQ